MILDKVVYIFCKLKCGLVFPALQAIQDIIINLKVLLINVTWDTQFENRSSEVFTNLSSVIENSVSNMISLLFVFDFFPHCLNSNSSVTRVT